MDHSDPHLWERPREVPPSAKLKALGGTPVSVLAGFALTSALEVSKRDLGPGRDISVAAFAFASGSFLLTLCFVIAAEKYAATPDLRLAYRPEARIDVDALEDERRDQLDDLRLLAHYEKKIIFWFTSGAVGALIGLAAALLTTRVTLGVVVGSLILAVVAVVQILSAGDRPRGLFRDHRNPPWATSGAPARIGTRGLAILQGRDHPFLPQARTFSELARVANERGAGSLYDAVVSALRASFDGCYTTATSVVFTTVVAGEHRRAVVVHPASSSGRLGVKYQAAAEVIGQMIGVDVLAVTANLPAATEPCNGDRSEYSHQGFFRDDQDVGRLLQR